ncbi:hypothetical protein [Chryseobacterium caseinilyticum]|uniref:VanZ-like domain-containing protein n=1 Tax=Chryseobacterium caseinilyticum TaxID=2771428 RepID=A0ABR8ZH01_9FLAO|nr:hypothetical protein [Chryseobacterium caseinilyticum]MBD8084586.1 hypothetical protein [Chryseobacterium caseinilyticum]
MSFAEIKDEIKLQIRHDKKYKYVWSWALVSIICVFALKWFRYRQFELSPTVDFLQGVLPNFFAATTFTAGFFIYYKLIFRTDNTTDNKLTISSAISFFGLVIWEFIQLMMGSPIDIYDIFTTFLGCLITFIFVKFLFSK